MLTNSSCSLAVDCLDCSLQGVGNWSIHLPWSYQLIEYEIWVTAAEAGASARLYGIMAPMASTQVLDKQAELHFSLLQAYYVDERKSIAAISSGAPPVTGELAPSALYTSGSGFELAYQFYQTIQAQNSSSLTATSQSMLSFVFNPSDIIYQTTVTNKTSQAQLLFSILASIVSLFSLFVIFFKGSEWIMKRVHLSPAELAISVINWQKTDDVLGENPAVLAAIQLQEIHKSASRAPGNLSSPSMLDLSMAPSDSDKQ